MHMVLHSRSITSESELNTSFLNPIERICFQICSMGFISGVYGGIDRSFIFSGQRNAFDLCQAAPSHTSSITSFGNCIESFSRNTFVQIVSQFALSGKSSLHSAALLHRMHNGIPVYGDMARKGVALWHTSSALAYESVRNLLHLRTSVGRFCLHFWHGRPARCL